MSYYQGHFSLNHVSQQLLDETYFNFQSDGDDDFAAKDFDAWPIPLDIQQGQPTGYAIQPYLDGSYLSPSLEPFESSSIQKVGPTQLQLNGGPESSTDFQTCQSPEQDSRTLGLMDDSGNLSLLSSPSLVDTETYNTRNYISRTRVARSSSDQPPKRGRPRKKRNPSSPSEDESAIQKAKDNHSVIERRYRDNLNGPALCSRVRKSDIMSRAVNYIHQSEVQIRHMDDEIKRLQDQVCIFQKLVHCDDYSLLKGTVELGGVQKS